MKQSMYKTRDELPMFLTVMDVQVSSASPVPVPTSWCVRTIFPSSRSFRDEPSSPVIGSLNGWTSRRDTTELHGERNNK